MEYLYCDLIFKVEKERKWEKLEDIKCEVDRLAYENHFEKGFKEHTKVKERRTLISTADSFQPQTSDNNLFDLIQILGEIDPLYTMDYLKKKIYRNSGTFDIFCLSKANGEELNMKLEKLGKKLNGKKLSEYRNSDRIIKDGLELKQKSLTPPAK